MQKVFFCFRSSYFLLLLFFPAFHNSFCEKKSPLHFRRLRSCLFVCLWITYLFINCRLASQYMCIRKCITFDEEMDDGRFHQHLYTSFSFERYIIWTAFYTYVFLQCSIWIIANMKLNLFYKICWSTVYTRV